MIFKDFFRKYTNRGMYTVFCYKVSLILLSVIRRYKNHPSVFVSTTEKRPSEARPFDVYIGETKGKRRKRTCRGR